MGNRVPREATPGRLFFGAFTGFETLLDWLRDALAREFGPLDAELESEVFVFPETRTYAKSMGPGLRRKFFFLEAPFPQDGLAAVKHRTLELEAEAKAIRDFGVERPINIDPGILNDCRVILASTKDYAHRIYRGEGIWEEITLVYTGGGFTTHPWTYPDFRQEAYHEYFERARARHLEFLRSTGDATGGATGGAKSDASQTGERPTEST